VHAWDGWCNYGIAENAGDQVRDPEGRQRHVGRHHDGDAASENKDAAMAFINYVLKPEVHKWVAENILYKVPNQKATELLDPALIAQYPNIGITPAD
jgi:spermidine/putrescine transport system substrate-binding protein